MIIYGKTGRGHSQDTFQAVTGKRKISKSCQRSQYNFAALPPYEYMTSLAVMSRHNGEAASS
jgi:hypothetical protein